MRFYVIKGVSRGWGSVCALILSSEEPYHYFLLGPLVRLFFLGFDTCGLDACSFDASIFDRCDTLQQHQWYQHTWSPAPLRCAKPQKQIIMLRLFRPPDTQGLST